MTFGRYVLWVALTVAAYGLLTLLQRPLRGKGRAGPALAALAGKVLLAAALALLLIAHAGPVAWRLSLFLGALYVALLGDGAGDLLLFLTGQGPHRPEQKRKKRAIGLFLTLVLLLYGTMNMQTIIPREHTWVSDKLDNEYTVVFLSDLHFGSAQSVSVVEKALAEIDRLDPDFLLLGGDITDEHTTKAEMEWLYQRIGALDIPTYFIYGNHDRQDRGAYLGGAVYTPAELAAAIEDNGLTILRDEFVQAAVDLVLLGREDFSAGKDRLPVEALPPRPDGAFVLSVDHSPFQRDDILATGADLQLSGHTHAGQLFPLRALYSFTVKVPYGEYRVGETDLYVSAGIAGWYLPLRTEARCSYEVIRLIPR